MWFLLLFFFVGFFFLFFFFFFASTSPVPVGIPTSYDEYVGAFQSMITGLWARRLCDKEGVAIKDEEEDEEEGEDVDMDMEEAAEDRVSPVSAEEASGRNNEDEGGNTGEKI
jgi:hypothetical protein